MARQIGEIKITGTVDGITFYKMYGEYFARLKSSLSRERVLRDPAFRGSRRSSDRLAGGSQLASRVYQALEKEKRVYGQFCEMKSMAMLALKEGMGEQEVLDLLQGYLVAQGVMVRRGFVETRTPAVERVKTGRRVASPVLKAGAAGPSAKGCGVVRRGVADRLFIFPVVRRYAESRSCIRKRKMIPSPLQAVADG